MLPLPLGYYGNMEPSVDPFISIGWIMGPENGMRIGGGITGKRTIESSQTWLSGVPQGIRSVWSWFLDENETTRLSVLLGSCIGGKWEGYLGHGFAASVDATVPWCSWGGLVFGLSWYPFEGVTIKLACNPLWGIWERSLVIVW
jgi:hypothetical protein